MSRDSEVASIARRRYGLFTLDQALAIGVTRRLIAQRVERGVYEVVAPGVYGVAGVPSSRSRRIVAAALTIGPGAVASHDTAAELWGIGPASNRIHVAVRRWRRRRRLDFDVHESLDLIDSDRTEFRAIPITSPARTVVDLGATSPWLVGRALDSGVRMGLFSLRDVESLVRRVGRRGRRGVGVIRPLLLERAAWTGATESALEDLFRAAISRSGLPMPVPQYEVRGVGGEFVCRADFAYPDRRLLIELDGVAYHTSSTDFQHDRTRQNRAALQGWRFLRYTWLDVTERASAMIWQIRSALWDDPAGRASLERALASTWHANR